MCVCLFMCVSVSVSVCVYVHGNLLFQGRPQNALFYINSIKLSIVFNFLFNISWFTLVFILI